MKYNPVLVAAAKTIVEQYDKQQVIVSWDAVHGKTHVTTCGVTAEVI